ncbi:response regulator transcription factor [Halalkalibacterium halodurans]|uniref:Two-component response regulator n=1 Tax=Halalkalibacterium halodurans (strain ATCC BAA-125 / DSM 18197 / FERM 7344 / JCM 9153 / C-125) TaxID=272558 RepID=Q9KAM3_HALH5|nr:response regulator transcription factor [Halalkalibacterium halodurans]MED4080953.1 response regulator transcription factor [Halalkalibacterium halodurans]MED4085136.1 response regulator transcription factor [Halalkalibacterium halodurans]MED4105286.1 response regulator transcription factor [Halalkalibacterium halodurans]MED4109095.1 response regulator transcription factor [Halalkalibacterium halodurans]MED4126109.1 response regulator transcription factor [Halalkalibacterium halodurans]
MERRVLVVDDEKKMQVLITVCVSEAGYLVQTAASGLAAMDRLKAEPFDLVLLDIMLPDVDGFSLIAQLRHLQEDVAIIMLTALGETEHIVRGLNEGADDYIVKPFEPDELNARILSVLRRKGGLASRKGEEKQLKVNEKAHDISFAGQSLGLTKTEYRVLHRLLSNPGRTYTREQLLDLAWDRQVEIYDRNVDAHIKNIRDKLEKVGADSTVIQTVWGVGYKYVEHEGINQ